MKKNKTGQSVIEYLLLVSAVIIVLIIFLNPSSFFRNTVENALNSSVNQLEDMANNLPFP